jgi:hypothetical protein
VHEEKAHDGEYIAEGCMVEVKILGKTHVGRRHKMEAYMERHMRLGGT